MREKNNYIDLEDPWEKERRKKRDKVKRWALGGKPPKWYKLFPPFLLGSLLITSGRVGIVVGDGSPIWLDIPSVPVAGGAMLVYALIQALRAHGHNFLELRTSSQEGSHERSD